MLSDATSPETSACALIEQIISSRQPLLVSVFETPMVYEPSPALPPRLGLPSPVVHAATMRAMPSDAVIALLLRNTFIEP